MKIDDFKKGMKFYLPGKMCVVQSVDKSKEQIHFEVINGAWDGRLDLRDLRVYIKYTSNYIHNQTPTLESQTEGL